MRALVTFEVDVRLQYCGKGDLVWNVMPTCRHINARAFISAASTRKIAVASIYMKEFGRALDANTFACYYAARHVLPAV
jgi:hypothetical protein